MTRLIGILAMTTLACGLIAWTWLDDWRWAVTGAAAMLVLSVVGSALDRRRE